MSNLNDSTHFIPDNGAELQKASPLIHDFSDAENLMRIADLSVGPKGHGVSPAFAITLDKIIAKAQAELLRKIEGQLPKNDFISIEQFMKIATEKGLYPENIEYKRLKVQATAGETAKLILKQVTAVIEKLKKEIEHGNSK